MNNKKRIYLLPAVIVFLGIVLFFWRPWETKKESVDFGSARETLVAVQVKTGQVENYKYKADITVSNQIKVTVSNQVEKKEPLRQLVDFSWKAPKMSGTATVFADGDQLYVFHPIKDKWLLPKEEPTIEPFLDFFWRQLTLIDPVQNVLKLNPNGSNISLLSAGTEAAGDTLTIQVIPEAGALTEINKALPPQFGGAELTDIKQLFWISRRDLMVTKYETHAKVAFFGLKTMDFTTVSVPRDYNKTKITLTKALQEKMALSQ